MAGPAPAASALHAPGGMYGTAAASVLSHEPLPAVQPAVPPVSRFITVEKDERLRAAADQSKHETPWIQIILLSIALASVVGLAIVLMRPPSADTLYTRIDNAVGKTPTPDRLIDAESNIESFLARFPNDPRSKQLKSYADELESLHLERQVELGQLLSGNTGNDPIEHDYAEAIHEATNDPEQAIAKLRRFWNSTANRRKKQRRRNDIWNSPSGNWLDSLIRFRNPLRDI